MFLSRKSGVLRFHGAAGACFNGAGMFLSRKCASHLSPAPAIRVLQWGRDVSIPEMGPLCCRGSYRRRASMGPGCFYPGNTVAIGAAGTAGGLQWGRDVSIPEITF